MLLQGTRNTIVFEHDEVLKNQIFKLFATNLSPQSQSECISDLLCCLPKIQAPASLNYQNVFRVLIMAFIDATNFDIRAMKKSCVHIAQADGKVIPFESYNLFYRNPEQRALLAKRRQEVSTMFAGDKITNE